MVDNDADVFPSVSLSGRLHHHGTSCAGVISMTRNNTACGVGVAYDARLAGVRLLSGSMQFDSSEARALGHMSQDIHIYSNSWGPIDDGITVDGPGPLTSAILRHGVTHVSYMQTACVHVQLLYCLYTHRGGVAGALCMCGRLVMVASMETRAVQMAMPPTFTPSL